MTRFLASFVLRMDRSYLIILMLGVLVISTVGCGIGINLVPLSAKIQNADNAYDRAEAITTRSDDPEQKEKATAQQRELYDRARSIYLEIIQQDTDGKYAQRAHHQIAKIYTKHYEWDKANEHFQAIIELAPTGYYASEAKSGIANIRRNRQVIDTELANYQNYKAIYDTEKSKESYNIAAESLYKVAKAYEALENYPQAIVTYERMVAEFPEHENAVQAQLQVGNIYFYELYDYTNSGGWGAFVAVAEKFPDTFEAKQVVIELNKTEALLREIKGLQDEIQRNKSKKAVQFEKLGRYVLPSEKWIQGKADLIVQNYQQIANNWEKLRNYPNAIETNRAIVDDLSHKKFAVADSLYKIGVLYQKNADYERAIQAFEDLLQNAAESTWRNECVYQQAVCYRAIREFRAAYKGFQAYMSITKGETPHFREAEQILRQYELDQDGDGYMFYEEQEAGTSDQDPNSHPEKK
ncbi:MAG: tetratricopeptide repeat protein [Candidatus Poribacteria bacterium]|nr:tetratricopeptide repeat protein [Candidatus Poribacteria bacterium]